MTLITKPDYSYPDIWTSVRVAMFSVPVGKIRCGHWSLLREKANLLYTNDFLEHYNAFSKQYRICSQFTTSKLAEQSCECCRTPYYVVAN